jgi:hypothetical protein
MRITSQVFAAAMVIGATAAVACFSSDEDLEYGRAPG